MGHSRSGGAGEYYALDSPYRRTYLAHSQAGMGA